MGSEGTLKLPVIDFNGLSLESNNPKWDEVRSQVQNALAEWGIFEALFDHVPTELRGSMLVELKELFDLPLEAKKRNVSDQPYRGYGHYPHAPLLESVGIDDAYVLENVEVQEKAMWPKGNPSFSKTIQTFTEKISELDKIVRKMFLESFGVEKYLDEQIDSTTYHLRLMKYSAPQTEEAKIGVDTHTDKNTTTILFQNEVDGLEVQTKDGKWFTHQPSSPNSFVVLAGDSFLAWTNGRVHPPVHKVMVKGKESRYSVGLFANPKGGHMVKAPEELVDEEHPLLYKPYDLVKFVEYISERAPKEPTRQFSLKDYCGA